MNALSLLMCSIQFFTYASHVITTTKVFLFFSLFTFSFTFNFSMILFLVPSGVPIDFEIVSVSSSEVTYIWNDNLPTVNGGLLGYNLFYAEEGQNPIRISFPVSALGPYIFVLTQLNANTRYSFSLSVFNDIGEGPNSTLIWKTTNPVGELFVLMYPL